MSLSFLTNVVYCWLCQIASMLVFLYVNMENRNKSVSTHIICCSTCWSCYCVKVLSIATSCVVLIWSESLSYTNHYSKYIEMWTEHKVYFCSLVYLYSTLLNFIVCCKFIVYVNLTGFMHHCTAFITKGL